MLSANGIINAIIEASGAKRRLPLVVVPARAALRLAVAHLNNAEARLIAYAALVGSEIRVWSCEPRTYQCPVSAIKALARVRKEQLGKFEISATGSRIHWPEADIDLGLDDFRQVCDEGFAKEQRSRVEEDLLRYGKAIRQLRLDRGLNQGDIAGLSEREVRRIEQGKHSPRVATLEKLAAAHGTSLKDYLDELAERS